MFVCQLQLHAMDDGVARAAQRGGFYFTCAGVDVMGVVDLNESKTLFQWLHFIG